MSDPLLDLIDPQASGPGVSSSAATLPFEVVVDSNGVPRHAGSDVQEGRYIQDFKIAAERHLYVFLKGVLGKHWLHKPLHVPTCEWFQDVATKKRKLLLYPREHCKTVIVSHGLPIHIHIQPQSHNIYFPGRNGSDIRIMLCGETQGRADENLAVVRQTWESNQLLRALWPEKVWQDPRRESRARGVSWSASALTLPRPSVFADPSIRSLGVGVAITGARSDVQIKDDLCTFEAANSPAVMQATIEWYKASLALQQSLGGSLEFIIGTRWSTYDLYQFILDEMKDVEVLKRSVIEDGEPIFPTHFNAEVIEQKRREHGSLFQLIYMNNAFSSELTDFDERDLRHYTIHGGELRFTEDERDLLISARLNAPLPEVPGPPAGTQMSFGELSHYYSSREEYFRCKNS